MTRSKCLLCMLYLWNCTSSTSKKQHFKLLEFCWHHCYTLWLFYKAICLCVFFIIFILYFVRIKRFSPNKWWDMANKNNVHSSHTMHFNQKGKKYIFISLDSLWFSVSFIRRLLLKSMVIATKQSVISFVSRKVSFFILTWANLLSFIG